MRLLYFCLIFLILPVVVSSQQYSFKTYSVEDGLAQSQVFAICQDSQGYMWFGTNGGGVIKYDGNTFITYTTKDGLCDNVVTFIFEDSKHNLWFGTNIGINKYDGKTFTNYAAKEGTNKTIWSIFEDKEGNLWFGTDDGVSKYNGETFTNFTINGDISNNTVWSISADKERNLWFGTNIGISKYDGKTFTNFTTKDNLKSDIIYYVLEDSKGNMWFGTDGGGIYKYDGKTFINFTMENGLKSDIIYSIFEDSKGDLWFGTDGGGASKYDGKTFVNYTIENGLNNNTIWSIFEDKEGNLWFGTNGGGVCKYSGETFIGYTTEEGLSNNIIYSICEDSEGNLWFGTYEYGVYKYNEKTFINYTTEEGLISNNIYSIVNDREGNLWIATSWGISKYDGESFTNINTNDGLINNDVRYIFEDNDSNLWFATHGGVSKYDGKSFTNFTTKNGLCHDYVSCILQDTEGNMWFTTDGGGVSKYDGKTFTNFTTKNGLSSDFVLCISEDIDGDLWFGTYGGGVSKYNCPKNGKVGTFETFTSEEGLCDNAVLLMIFDNVGNLWIGTNKGLDKFDVLEYNKTGKKIFEHYGKEEGFIGIECNQKAVYQDSKGNLWFGTIKGVFKYNSKEDKPNTEEPFTYITNLRLFFKNIDWTIYTDDINKISGLPIGLRLPYKQNHLTFDFIGISLTIPSKVRFQYILEGIDKDWSPAIKENHVTYSNLPPGEYTFKLKACNNDGVWNKEPTAYNFIIIPPFWQTWWFRFTMLILAGMIIYGIFLLKTAQLRLRTKILEQKVNERTAQLRETQKMLTDTAHRAGMAEIATGILHNVGNVLNSVKVSSQLLKEKIKSSKVNNLQKVLSLMEEHTDNIGKFITSDEKGKMLPEYLIKVGITLKEEQDNSLKELSTLHDGINHIEEIIAVQQSYAGVSGLVEKVALSAMMDDVLKMHSEIFRKYKINIIKKYSKTNPILIEKGKLIQVFVNLLKNAKESLEAKDEKNRIITINILEDKQQQTVEITDNGTGISKENLTKMFSYGFSTKKEGKGFGLHTSALAMTELKGKLIAQSDGKGKGAKFIVKVTINTT